ncbi:MAG: L,D-transpeptidase [Syntrophaceae bacterium]
MLHRIAAILTAAAIAVTIIIWEPQPTSLPSASQSDPRKEDLSRIEYPSTKNISWRPYFMKPDDRLETLFGSDWVHVARFNRIDRHHAYPGMTIKRPERVWEVRNYNPMPLFYEPARNHAKYILISITEQWLAGYEYGKLKVSFPAATGTEKNPTPTGVFRIDAHDRWHSSSLYKVKDYDVQYPMDYALRFHIEDGISYWIHARDLPGRPASHGCIGLLCEPMQKRTYGAPENPVMDDAAVLYRWVVVPGEDEGQEANGIIENGPVVEVTGGFPVYASK